MATSRKDYVATAAIVKQALENTKCHYPAAIPCVMDMAYRFADLYKADNSRFDRERFLSACGID